jgi:hypothetical protein
VADTIITVNGATSSEDGIVYSAVAYYDGESFYSFVFSESDVSGEQNKTVTLLEKPCGFTDIWQSKSGRLFVCDDQGRVHAGKGSRWTASQVSPRPLATVWGSDDKHVYAGGADGIVYRWDGAKWSAFSSPLGNTILCIAGSSPKDLYVCGEGALFWRFDGKTWNQIALPTKAVLVGLLVVSADDVLVSGSGGALFRGAGSTWANVSQRGKDFYKMALYRKSIYIAGGGQGVFELKSKAVSNVKDSFPVYRLAANAAYLTLAGGNSAIRYDGTDWFGPDYT